MIWKWFIDIEFGKEVPLHQIKFDFGLGMDPITLFLALAFADNAFEGDITLETLVEKQRSQTCGARWFKWKPSVSEKPVIRQCAHNSMVSETRGMTYDTLLKEFHHILRRSGFLVKVSLYGIRRGAANALNGNGWTWLREMRGRKADFLL